MSADAPRVVPLSLRARVLAPIRGGLSLVGLAASAAASGRADVALIGWAAGAGVTALLLRADPRGRRHRRPEPLPAGVATESAAEIARGVAFTGVRRCTPVASVHRNATRSSKKSAIPTITEPLRLVARATLFGKSGGGAPSATIPVSAVQRNACGAPEASKLAPPTTRPSLERARPWEATSPGSWPSP